MDIVPIITKDNLSKEQIEYLQKQQTEYKLVNKIKREPGHILFSFNRKTGGNQEGFYYTQGCYWFEWASCNQN